MPLMYGRFSEISIICLSLLALVELQELAVLGCQLSCQGGTQVPSTCRRLPQSHSVIFICKPVRRSCAIVFWSSQADTLQRRCGVREKRSSERQGSPSLSGVLQITRNLNFHTR